VKIQLVSQSGFLSATDTRSSQTGEGKDLDDTSKLAACKLFSHPTHGHSGVIVREDKRGDHPADLLGESFFEFQAEDGILMNDLHVPLNTGSKLKGENGR
jgi:hypothetical protein